jgi:periplasmic protein TonB
MKPIFFSIFSMLLFANFFSQTNNRIITDATPPMKERKIADSILVVEKDTIVYGTVDQPAEFPGGLSALSSFINKNISYPAEEMERGIQGKCIIKFVINTDGRVIEAEVLKGIPGGANCDKEALRIVRKLPNWRPAVLNGKHVRMYYQLPIMFVIAED